MARGGNGVAGGAVEAEPGALVVAEGEGRRLAGEEGDRHHGGGGVSF